MSAPTTRVDVRPASGPRSDFERDLAIADKLGTWLDSKYSLGGIKFGFDSIIGLVPVVGDVATATLSLYPVYLAGRHRLVRGSSSACSATSASTCSSG